MFRIDFSWIIFFLNFFFLYWDNDDDDIDDVGDDTCTGCIFLRISSFQYYTDLTSWRFGTLFQSPRFFLSKNCDICDTWCDTLVTCHTCLGYFVLPTFLGAIFLLRSNLRVKKILKWSLLPKGWDANPWCSWWSSSPWWLNSSLRILSFHGWIEIVLLIPAAVRRLEPPGGVKIAPVTRGRS